MVSFASASASFEEALSIISSKNITSRTYGFLNREMGICMNFV